MLAATTGAFGLFAGVLLLPRYFQTARDVSATHSGLLIYPLLIGLLVSVNVAGASSRAAGVPHAAAGRRGARRGGCGRFRVVRRRTPDWQSLVLMGLIGVGIGPTLSGLQIAIQRIVAPPSIGAAMGTLMLLRQIGGSIALTAAATLYAGGLHSAGGLQSAAASTGDAIFVVTLLGSAIAALALISLPRGAQPPRRVSADPHGRPDRHALVERDDVGDVHADAAVRGARADRAVLAGAVDADAVGDPHPARLQRVAALPPVTVVPASSPAQGLLGTDQTGLTCLLVIEKRPRGVGYCGWPTATL